MRILSSVAEHRSIPRLRSDAAVALEMLAQQPHVPAIGTECYVEGIANKRHRSNNALDRHIGKHAQEQAARHSQPICLVEQKRGKGGGGDIADAGNEPKNGLYPVPDISAG